MGAGQGLSLLRGDFGLPIFQYHELDDFTDAVVREANTMWDDWKGTAIYKTSNDEMQLTLLNRSAVCGVDADQFGCEARRLCTWSMGCKVLTSPLLSFSPCLPSSPLPPSSPPLLFPCLPQSHPLPLATLSLQLAVEQGAA
jgi:hypothetical protein